MIAIIELLGFIVKIIFRLAFALIKLAFKIIFFIFRMIGRLFGFANYKRKLKKAKAQDKKDAESHERFLEQTGVDTSKLSLDELVDGINFIARNGIEEYAQMMKGKKHL